MVAFFGRSCAVLCLVWLAGRSRAEVKVEKNAYQNVVVSFSPRINPENGLLSLNSMKDLLRETSSVLQNAIGIKIGSVIFHLPLSWNSSGLEGIEPALLTSSGLKPDIRVEGITDSAFGQHPYALQYSACGVPGVDITVPDGFLAILEPPYPRGKLLAREWLKYRYGVFNENGFHNDPKYPLHFIIDGSNVTKVTDCTNPEVHYHYKDSKGKECSLQSDDCKIYPDEKSAENVKSSLMFFHESLPNVLNICGKDSHNVESPNKQNILCKYQSIEEIVKTSEDFKTEQVNPDNQDIQFSYVQESPVRVVLSWMSSKKLLNQGDIIKKAVKKFLYDLPLHSKYVLYPFNALSEDIKDMTELEEDASRGRAEFLSDFSIPDGGCIICAIKIAAVKLQSDNPDQKGTIFMIVASDPEKDETLVNTLTNSNLCLVIAAFPGATKDGWNELIATSQCNSIREIPASDDEKETFLSLYEIMETILPMSLDDTKTSTVAVNYLPDANFSIPANSMAASYTLWIFNYIQVHSIKCEADNKEIELRNAYEPNAELSSYYFLAPNMDVICKCRHSSCPRALVQVRMTSQKGAYFQIDAWTYDTTPKDSKEQMPVMIYARLSYGQHPILGAEIKAIITGPNGVQYTIPLFDDGIGDPDITSQDGIYSRYFTQFVSEGDYSVEIMANDNEKKARYGRNGKEPCCGSIVQSESVEIEPFQLTFNTNFHAISARPENGYKPSRIVDLNADTSDFPNSITLKWTAPGGEADHGQANEYILKSFTSREDAIQKFDDTGRQLNVTLTPKTISDSEEFKIDLSDFEDDATYYFALRSASATNITSDTSNIIVLSMPAGVRMTTVDDDTTEPPAQKRAELEPKTIGLIVGLVILVIVIIICIYLAVYCFYVKPKRRKEEQETRRDTTSRRHNGSVGLNSIPADVILKHHKEVVTAKHLHKDPPIFTEENLESIHVDASSSSDNVSQDANDNYSVPNKPKTSTFQPPKTKPKAMTTV